MSKINFPQANPPHLSFKKKNYFIVQRLILVTILLFVGPFFLGAEETLYKTSYVCYEDGDKERWRASTEIMPFEGEGEGVYRLIEEGQGYYSGFDGKISWVSEMIFKSNEKTIKPLKMKKKVFDEKGREIAVILQDFDYSAKKVKCIFDDLINNSKTEKEFRIRTDIINRLTLGLYVQKFLENGQKKKVVDLLSSEPALYRFVIKVVKSESIEVNGQTKEAYKLYLNPDVGLLGVFKALIPKAFVWHSSSPRYEWFKYTGLERGIDSPTIRIEVVD